MKLNKTANPMPVTTPEPPAQTGGSSASAPADNSTADLEQNLLSGQGGGEQPAPTPAPNQNPAAGAQPGGESKMLKNIQQLTGKLTQDMRTAGDQIQGTDIKAVINSILAAADLSKLDDSDVSDITNKLSNPGTGGEQAPAAPAPEAPQAGAEQPGGDISEIDDESQKEDANPYENIVRNPIFRKVVDAANLEYELQHDQESMCFQFCEAAYVFIHDYNENNEFINGLKEILRTNDFKPKLSLQSKENLEYFGDEMYEAMIICDRQSQAPAMSEFEASINDTSRYTASGGQTIGEEEMLDEIISRVLAKNKK